MYLPAQTPVLTDKYLPEVVAIRGARSQEVVLVTLSQSGSIARLTTGIGQT